MDAETIRTYAEIGTAIGTSVLALATFKFAADVSRQAKRDRITREMDFLISPLMIVYREIESWGIVGNWWVKLYTDFGDASTTEKFRNAIKNIDQYRYLAPEKLRQLIDEFMFCIYEMHGVNESGNLENFKQLLVNATTNLYFSTNVKGGLVERRYYELTNELDALNKDLVSKTHDFFANKRSWLNRKLRPPKLIQPT